MVQANVLDDVAINRIAPSVFAREAWQETSGSYRFLPTISIVNALRDSGFNVVKVAQSRCRIEVQGEGHVILYCAYVYKRGNNKYWVCERVTEMWGYRYV